VLTNQINPETKNFYNRILKIFLVYTRFRVPYFLRIVVSEWSKEPDWEIRSEGVRSIPAMPAIFQPQIANNINKVPPIRATVIYTTILIKEITMSIIIA